MIITTAALGTVGPGATGIGTVLIGRCLVNKTFNANRPEVEMNDEAAKEHPRIDLKKTVGRK